jgi:peroxiredoxin
MAQAKDPEGLRPGDKAPFFHAEDQFGEVIDLEKQLASGPVVLMFYRGHWCKYCNKQLEELSDSLQYLAAKGASIIAVTPEVMEFVDETSKKFDDAIRIISDKDMKIMNAYGVSFEVSGFTVLRYKTIGIDLNEFNGNNGTSLPVPATYIINQDGMINYAYFDKNYKKRVSVKTLLMNL